MPGSWLVTTVENNKELSTSATTAQTKNIDLPRGNYLGRVNVRLFVVGTGSPDITLSRVRLVAGGSSAFIDVEGGQLRAINKFQNGTTNAGVGQALTNAEWNFSLNLGRFYRDEQVIFPAKIFKQLQLQLLYTVSTGTPTRVAATITAEEFVSKDPVKSKLIRRLGVVETTASAANLIKRTRLNLGSFLRAVYIHTDDPDNVNANTPLFGGTVESTSPIRVLVNNGSEIPFQSSFDMIKLGNQETYRFDDGDTPDSELSNLVTPTGTEEMVIIDFDPLDTLEHILDTSKLNDISVEFTAAASGTSGDTHIITDEILPVVG